MKKIILSALLIVGLYGCNVVKQMQEDFSKLKFKIHSVQGVNLNSMNLSDKSKFSDFGALEIVKLTSMLTSGKMPMKFTVNVEALNSNKMVSSYTSSMIRIKSFPFTLLLNDKEAFKGNINEPIEVPGGGESTLFPVDVEFDLLKLVNDQGLSEIVNLALKLGGQQGSPANIKVVSRPVLDTPLGEYQYPSELTIVNTTYN
ncbi:MAG: hypothetical protein K9J12_00405 [Melioribacteraceae bacterium]|nr:hypothetical protein [Melioribacteraceae bacterium]MCF8264361.1 hypothetical protein [Melioribacteraceae bacterium]MCF8413418.1 hypothetical protein [Melioribacteraceae bacterium]